QFAHIWKTRRETHHEHGIYSFAMDSNDIFNRQLTMMRYGLQVNAIFPAISYRDLDPFLLSRSVVFDLCHFFTQNVLELPIRKDQRIVVNKQRRVRRDHFDHAVEMGMIDESSQGM